MDGLCELLTGRANAPKRPLVITFDDGYMDNYEEAFPVLKEFGFPATFFIISGLAGQTNRWDIVNGFRERRLMGWREIGELQRYGMTIGAHTVNHCMLNRVPEETASREVGECKRQLEDRLGTLVDHFAYPYGALNESIMDLVKSAGYRSACSVEPGSNTTSTHLFRLRRSMVCGTDRIWHFVRQVRHTKENRKLETRGGGANRRECPRYSKR